MDNILRDEVNQHTSDEVEKVLAELEAQGVDLTAIKEALANSGGMQVKRIQTGRVTQSSAGGSLITVAIEAVDLQKSICFSTGSFYNTNTCAQPAAVRFKDAKTLEVVTYIAYSSNKPSYADWYVIEFE